MREGGEKRKKERKKKREDKVERTKTNKEGRQNV